MQTLCDIRLLDVELIARYVQTAGDAKEVKGDCKEQCAIDLDIKSNHQDSLKLETNLPSAETIDFTVIYNKHKYDVQFPIDDNVGQLKKHLDKIIGK